MLLEGGAALNLFDTGHHLLTLRPATSIASCWRMDLAVRGSAWEGPSCTAQRDPGSSAAVMKACLSVAVIHLLGAGRPWGTR